MFHSQTHTSVTRRLTFIWLFLVKRRKIRPPYFCCFSASIHIASCFDFLGSVCEILKVNFTRKFKKTTKVFFSIYFHCFLFDLLAANSQWNKAKDPIFIWFLSAVHIYFGRCSMDVFSLFVWRSFSSVVSVWKCFEMERLFMFWQGREDDFLKIGINLTLKNEIFKKSGYLGFCALYI